MSALHETRELVVFGAVALFLVWVVIHCQLEGWFPLNQDDEDEQ